MPYDDKEIKAFRVVAVEGNNNDWAAYSGPVDWTIEKVVANGNKIPQAVAAYFFPKWNANLQWRT